MCESAATRRQLGETVSASSSWIELSQRKLLRILQERAFAAVGDDWTREVDVRVTAAT